MEEKTEKKFLGMDAIMVAVIGLLLTILSVVIVLATFAFNTIRADYARIEADIAELRAEQKAESAALRAERKADIEGLRADQKADVNRLETSIEGLRAERKADIENLRTEQRANTNMLSDKIDALEGRIDGLEDRLDGRLDEIEREQARMQGAVEVLGGRQAPNP